MFRNACMFAAGLSTALAVAINLPARAGTGPQDRLTSRNAVESCQGALPAYDNVLRKRPLGIVNESNSTVFVTCSMTAVDANDYTINNVDVYFGRTQAGDTTITCLLVPGTGIDSTMDAYIRSTQDTAEPLHWNATLIDRPWWRNVNLSCALPPGVELRYIETDYNFNEPGN